MMNMLHLFAELPSPPINEVGHWLWAFVAIVLTIGGMLHAWNQGRQAFGKSPSTDEQVKAFAEKVETEIKAVDHRRSAGVAGAHGALERHARELRGEIVPRAALEAELKRLDTDQRAISLRVETVAGMVEDAKDEVLQAGEARMATMTKRLDHLDRLGATHEERSKNTQHAMDSLNSKIDSLLRDRGLPTQPQRTK